MKLLKALQFFGGFFRRSLAARLSLLAFLSIALVCAAFSAMAYRDVTNALRTDITSNGRRLTTVLARMVTKGVFAQNRDEIGKSVACFARVKGLLSVAVCNLKGRTLFTTGGVPIFTDLRRMQLRFKDRPNPSGYFDTEGNRLVFYAPVMLDIYHGPKAALVTGSRPLRSGAIGFVQMVFDEKTLLAAYAPLVASIIPMGLGLLLVVTLATYPLWRQITTPLKKLTREVESVGQGVNAATMPVMSTDEVGRLTAAFNSMREALKTAERERGRLTKELQQSQKLEAIGLLAGGIAHDFNNILTGILSHAGILKSISTTDEMERHIDGIYACATTATAVTRNLLTFGRSLPMRMEVVDLNEIVREAEILFASLIDRSIAIRSHLSEGPMAVMADPAQIKQIFLNLALNARDAMPNGGRLNISTAATELNNLELDNRVFGVRGRYAVIIVADSGIGMPQEIKNKIFDPFFTTKDIGMGTGLGLSIAYGIVKSHNGYIDVLSEPGIGTTFKIYLPLVKGGLPKGKATKKPVVARSPRGDRILLVEDDPLLREVTADTLRREGYEVLEASNGEEAIARLEANGDVHLVLCDVVMTKKNGREVYEWTRSKKRDVHFLFTTGYSADIFRDGVFPEDAVTFVSKPYTSDLLLMKLGEVLSADAGESDNTRPKRDHHQAGEN